VGFGVVPRPLVDSRFAASDEILHRRADLLRRVEVPDRMEQRQRARP
jgi:hypothetical protein